MPPCFTATFLDRAAGRGQALLLPQDGIRGFGRPISQLPDMPPLWAPPAPMPPSSRQHNGGPLLEPRGPGRPRISTPELRERLLALLFEGLPLRVICRTPGMPSREAIYAWRTDPNFDRSCRFIADAGRINLVELVSEEVDRLMEQAGPDVARRVFDLRRRQLVRVNPHPHD
jgi:hypothetical protein